MKSNIRKYYWLVGTPIALVILGTVLFFDLIASTLSGNPHPQINYLIFFLVAVGCIMMLMQVARMNREARFIEVFYGTAHSTQDREQLRALLEQHRTDANRSLEMVTDVVGQKMSPVQHSALESELHRYQSKQNRYLILPQYMSGMMVGLGLLGTFIGLLGALAEIGKLIGAFSLSSAGGDPSDAIRILVERLTAPMQAMGVAFSASLFGVLGSLIMGVLMVGVRNCAGELVSLLNTRAIYLTDFVSVEHEPLTALHGAEDLHQALGSLVGQSPLLAGLVKGLDQSEQRVRDLILGIEQLSSVVREQEYSLARVVQVLDANTRRDEATLTALQETQTTMGVLAQRWATAQQVEEKIYTLLTNQELQFEEFQRRTTKTQALQKVTNQALTDALTQQQETQKSVVEELSRIDSAFKETAARLHDGLGDVTEVQRSNAERFVQSLESGFQYIAALQHSKADQINTTMRSGLNDIVGAQRHSLDELIREVSSSINRVSEAISRQEAREERQFSHQIEQLSGMLSTFAEHNLAELKAFLATLHDKQGELST